MAGIYEKAGIKSGSCSVTFSKDSTFSLVIGSRTLKGTYAFESATHGITLTFSGSGELRKFGAMHGFAYLNGTDLQLLFSAAKALSLIQQVGEKAASLNSSLATVNSLASKIDNLYLGFEFAK